MSYPITVSLIPGLPLIPFRNGVGSYEGTVGHATDVYNDTALSERNFEASHYQNAFVHFFVDHTAIVQVADINHEAWGAGPVANARYIHIELCQSADAAKFQEAYNRYVWLHAKLLHDKNLGVSRGKTFWTHSDVTRLLGGTTHQDPDAYLASHGVTIDKLVADISAQYNEMSKVAAVSVAAPKPAAAAPVTGNVKVLVTQLRVRTGPGTNYPIVNQSLAVGTYKYYQKKNDWYCLGGAPGHEQWAYGANGKYLEEV